MNTADLRINAHCSNEYTEHGGNCSKGKLCGTVLCSLSKREQVGVEVFKGEVFVAPQVGWLPTN